MGGARDQRTAGGGVLQPQGVNPAGGVAFGLRLLPLPRPPRWRGLFGGCGVARMAFAFVGRPRSKDPRQHGRHPARTGVLSLVDRPPPGLAKLMETISDPRAADAEASSSPLDSMGWASLAAGLLVVLTTFFTSYSHVDLIGFLHFKVNQQIGIPLLLAAMAALVGEVKLASNHRRADQRAREREAYEADPERYRAANERKQTHRRYRIQARCLVAQYRFLLAGTPRNRLQLNEALALLIEELRPAEG